MVDIPDVVTYTNFGDHRLRGFWMAGGQISPSPIDFHRRPYNTLALPCERVIDYSSAVDLVALRFEQCPICCRFHCVASKLICKYCASSDTYRSTLQSSSFIDSGCYPSTEAGQNTAPHLHTVPFLIHDHQTAPCSTCVAFNCIAPWQCSQLFSDFAKHFDF